MLSNTVQPALRAIQTAVEVPMWPAAAAQTRSFSASTSRQRIVSFPRGSNPGLNKTLDEIQKKIILPAQLPLYQRKKIFRGRWKDRLAVEPIELEIDDLKVRFKHLDGCGGAVPGARKMLWTAVEQMKTKEDWQILPKLMQALSHARSLKDDTWTMLIRRAGKTRNLGPIFDLAKRPLDDGLRLDTHEKVQKFLSGIVHEVAAAGWTRPAATRGLRYAEKVFYLLNDEDHKPKSGSFRNMSKDPAFLATPMTMAAVLVQQHGLAAEYNDSLQRYVKAVLRYWPADTGILTLYPSGEYVEGGGLKYLMYESQFLTLASPIVKGFELVEQCVAPDVAAQVASRRAAVAEEIASSLQRLRQMEENGGRKFESHAGSEMYKLCFPSKLQTESSKGEPVGAAA